MVQLLSKYIYVHQNIHKLKHPAEKDRVAICVPYIVMTCHNGDKLLALRVNYHRYEKMNEHQPFVDFFTSMSAYPRVNL